MMFVKESFVSSVLVNVDFTSDLTQLFQRNPFFAGAPGLLFFTKSKPGNTPIQCATLKTLRTPNLFVPKPGRLIIS
jgi:hypothetical protein